MLLRAVDSAVLLMDVQEKITRNIVDHERLVANCHWMIRLAKKLKIPVLASLHDPKDSDPLVAPLRQLLSEDAVMEKKHFSFASDPKCLKRINDLGKHQILLIGIETHICILQTAIELHSEGKQVFIVANATSSRFTFDVEKGLQRMRAAGIQIVTKEMVFCEWLRQSGTPLFRELSDEFMK